MHSNALITTLFGGAVLFGSSNAVGCAFGVEYTTEWQTDFRGGYDWLNLLKTTAEIPLFRGATLEASTVSVAKTAEEPLIDDLLTYSNIEAGNIALTFARFGLGFAVDEAEIFAGINNVNEDYFTSELTSFFTNSSCGISPTISCNFDIANYPLASWCLHYRQGLGRLSLQTSLYPGRGTHRLAGHDNLFSLNLRRDGIFSISSIDYQHNGIYTVLGVALHYGVCMGDENGEPTAEPASEPKKKLSASPWFLSEFSLPNSLGLIAHASVSTVKSGCRGYAGVGLVYDGAHVSPGVSVNYASFTSEQECDIELTARVPMLSGAAYLQPALHIVCCDRSSTRCAGLLRFNLTL